MAEYETVTYTVDEAVAEICLNRPDARNAINEKMRFELSDALKRAAADDSVRAVILAGAGQGFSAGADLKEGLGTNPETGEVKTVAEILEREYRPSFDAIMDMPKPVISAIAGPAAGIGLSLAMVCDLCVIAEDGYLLCPFSSIGLVPDGGANWLLVRQVGYKRAYQLAVEAERIPAARALQLGLVNKVVPAEELMEVTHRWAKSLAARAPRALANTKKAMRIASAASYDELFRLEAQLQLECADSEDFKEGVAAFVEKRAPRFTGN